MSRGIRSSVRLAQTFAVAIIALAVIASGTTPARADTAVSVPDPGLHACIASALEGAGLPDAFTTENLAKLTSVSCSYSPMIHSLAGIESLPGLRDLDLHVDASASLAPVGELPALASFWLHTDAAHPGSLAVSPTVTNLLIDGPRLTDLDGLATNTGVQSLAINDTPALTSLKGVEKLTGLRSLDVRTGHYSLAPLATLTSLEELRTTDAQITDLAPLSGLTMLSDLSLNGNQIADLSPLSNLPRLQALSAYDNRITDLSPLAGLPLRTLQVSGNRLTSLGPDGSLSGLTSVSAFDNQLTSIDALRGATALTGIDLRWNRLTDVKVLSTLAPKAGVALGWNRLRDLSPLPDDAIVRANDQADLRMPDAKVGKAIDIGLRSVSGRPICPTFDPRASCRDGLVTYPVSGTYLGTVEQSTDGALSMMVTQHAGPDRAFTRTRAPVVSGQPVIGADIIATVPAWTPARTSTTYRWYREGKKIAGTAAAGRFYRVVRADRGHRLSVCITGHRDGFISTTRCSARTPKARR